ncbi:MAG: coenzyme F430 synthase [Candidatus Helarchaeota archaeon]
MRFVIVDMTHGGKILAKELKIMGNVIGIDIYNTINADEKRDLKNKKILIKNNLSEISLNNKDIVIAPVHCDPKFLSKAIEKKIPIFTFHKIVGNLLRSELLNKFIVEITGTRGKTTTALVLANFLSYEKDVLCLSSRGLELFKSGRSTCLNKDIEIAPPYLLKVKEYLTEFEIAVFEISLGGTGLADIGVITNIIEDYPIANSTQVASFGKKQILELAKENSLILFNNDDENTKKLVEKTKTIARLISFGETGEFRAKRPVINSFNKSVPLEINYNAFFNSIINGNMSCNIFGGLIGKGYFYAFLIYIGVALVLNIDKNKIVENLERFKGIKNRLEFSRINGCWILTDMNSGVSHLSIQMALDSLYPYLKLNDSKIVLVIDTVSRVCEKISEAKIQKIISDKKFLIDEVYATNSKIGKPFQDLNQLINELIKKTGEKNIIFIAKKTKG